MKKFLKDFYFWLCIMLLYWFPWIVLISYVYYAEDKIQDLQIQLQLERNENIELAKENSRQDKIIGQECKRIVELDNEIDTFVPEIVRYEEKK